MTRTEILDAAKKCVTGGRDIDYGQPEDNFGTIARLWFVYINAAHPDRSFLLEPEDVAMMLALVKIARIAKGRSPDSFVDLAGYAACAGEIAGQEE